MAGSRRPHGLHYGVNRAVRGVANMGTKKSKSMGITVPSVASRSRRAAAMGKQPPKIDETALPADEPEAVQQAVARMLQAASLLLTAADMADEGACVDQYINAAIRLRDLANSLSPGDNEWPKDGAAIYDIKTKARLN